MIILGIDPGSRKTGFGVIEIRGKEILYINSGVLNFEGTEDFFSRLSEIYSQASNLVSTFCPQEISIESLIYVKSPLALIKLAQARGAMLSAFGQTHKGKIFEYSPNLVKSVAADYGHASKANVQKILNLFLGPKEFKTHDESDALAMAICHASLRMSKTFSGPKKGSLQKNRKRSLSENLAHKVCP